ncbi:MAG: prepilin-type N-terminal cleavage/methylation domain-containing protein [Nitrospirales bacterium]|nr:MAG: prepilin-type N-terminal cleavage/methylation domain-containing protein [Nitrospirales bacterium]
MMLRWQAASREGFTLIEMVVALGLSLVTVSAVYTLYVSELRAQLVREDMLEMQQQARVVMDVVSHEILMAGYDPRGANNDVDLSNDFLGITFDPGRLMIKADLNGNGLLTDANESIIFVLDGATHTLRRNTGGGNQPFGESIESFLVEYFDQGGNPTIDSRSIRQVKIAVTARTEDPDLKYVPNGGYRTVTLQSRLTPRNL